jgi:NAD(P)-dependent dehydrogenase (short-subunit alcohol dehydrogenase family)
LAINSRSKRWPISLKEQVPVVTGGGRGIRRAIARSLADAGARVAAVARSAGELGETVRLIEQKSWSRAADALSGRFLQTTDNLELLLASAAEIERETLYSLRIRRLGAEQPNPALAAMRADAERAGE